MYKKFNNISNSVMLQEEKVTGLAQNNFVQILKYP